MDGTHARIERSPAQYKPRFLYKAVDKKRFVWARRLSRPYHFRFATPTKLTGGVSDLRT